MSRKAEIERLRERIGRITSAGGAVKARSARGAAQAPAILQDLPSSCLHEIEGASWDAETGAATAAFAASLLRRYREGMILWAVPGEAPFAPRISAFGLHPDRVIFCRCRKDHEVLASLEEALRTPGIVAAVGEIAEVTLTQSRRLHLICERSGATSFVLRRPLHGASSRRKAQGSAAATRWRVGFAPSGEGVLGGAMVGLGPPRWRLDLLYCRGGMPASFLVEWNDETGDLHLVAKLADHEALPGNTRLRRAG